MRSRGVAGVAEVLSALDAEDVGGLPDAVLRDDLLALMVALNRLHAQVLRRVEAFDARGLAAEDGCRTARSWLRAFGRLSGHVASAWVKAARALRHLPALAEAAVSGRVPAEQIGRVVALVDRVGVEPVRDVDRVLADAATRLDPGGLQQVCDRVRAHVDPDGAEPDAHVDYRRRAITVSPFDGMMLVRGQLDPEGGAALLTALDAMTPPPAGGDDRTPAQRRADALVELARGALVTGSVPVVGGVRPQIAIVLTPDVLGRPMSERALAEGEEVPIRRRSEPFLSEPLLSEPFLPEPFLSEATSSEPAPGDPPEPPWPAASGREVSPPVALPPVAPWPEPPWLEWAGPFARSTARRIACDADVWRVVLDPTSGLPLDVGRAHRLVPYWIRKALWARDRGCRFPGCHAPAVWTDAHHVRTPWADGGGTDVDNLVLLCRHHHVLAHEGGWQIHVDRDSGTVSASRPGGTPYEIEPSRPWTGPFRRAA